MENHSINKKPSSKMSSVDIKTLPRHEKLKAIEAIPDYKVRASMLYTAAIDADPCPSFFTRLFESKKIEFLTDNVFAVPVDYFLKHGLLNTLKQIYYKLTIKTDQNESSTIWDHSSEQYAQKGFKLYWELLNKVREYQLSVFTGGIVVDYDIYCTKVLRGRTNKQNLKCLVLGCHESDNAPEICFYNSGMFESIEVMDIAHVLVDKQRAKRAQKGMSSIQYTVTDLNHTKLQPNTYDLIWSMGTIHHIQNLEHLFSQIAEALTSDGIFFTRDYVGPSRMQFTEHQLSIVNGLLALLPEAYRKDKYGKLKEREIRPSLSVLKRIDPSESVRSGDILEVMSGQLKMINLAQTGGTVLQPLLNRIASNFEGDSYGEALLEMLINFEKYLVGEQIVLSDYISCLAEKKAS